MIKKNQEINQPSIANDNLLLHRIHIKTNLLTILLSENKITIMFICSLHKKQ